MTNAERIRNMSDEDLSEQKRLLRNAMDVKMDSVVMLCNGFNQKQNRREYGRQIFIQSETYAHIARQ